MTPFDLKTGVPARDSVCILGIPSVTFPAAKLLKEILGRMLLESPGARNG